MKIFLTILVLLISIPSIVVAQRTGYNPSLTRTQIKEAEQRLSDLGYWTGNVDGVFDAATQSALVAFQKWEGRDITVKITVDELEAIRSGDVPTPKESGYGHVEVDVDRQVLMLVSEDGRVRVLPVSTGSNKPFMDEGEESIAYTPRGRFVVYDKTPGWEPDMGRSMYYSSYISGGVAIHGSPNVPANPASHGCVRVPMFAARQLSKLLPIGTIVLVYDKVSFVSAKEWIKNPQLKQATLAANAAVVDYINETAAKQSRPEKVILKNVRPRITRA
jgi:lipoprotein-anchoring transpeptidase ErfK/SrfK